MSDTDFKKGAAYFAELSRRFAREHIESLPTKDDRMLILLDGQEIGVVMPEGVMRIRKEWSSNPEASDLYHRAESIADEVREYMALMETALPLKAQSLDSPYRMLADFNGAVLGGMASMRGVQFTTWMWSYEKKGLNYGHYYGNDYAAAKKDFALRAGLVPDEKRFTPEQLIEIYRCCADTIAQQYELTYEQEQRIKDIQTQITEMVPDFEQRLQQEIDIDPSGQVQQTM